MATAEQIEAANQQEIDKLHGTIADLESEVQVWKKECEEIQGRLDTAIERIDKAKEVLT